MACLRWVLYGRNKALALSIVLKLRTVKGEGGSMLFAVSICRVGRYLIAAHLYSQSTVGILKRRIYTEGITCSLRFETWRSLGTGGWFPQYIYQKYMICFSMRNCYNLIRGWDCRLASWARMCSASRSSSSYCFPYLWLMRQTIPSTLKVSTCYEQAIVRITIRAV
jgi:hypothetical protein